MAATRNDVARFSRLSRPVRRRRVAITPTSLPGRDLMAVRVPVGDDADSTWFTDRLLGSHRRIRQRARNREAQTFAAAAAGQEKVFVRQCASDVDDGLAVARWLAPVCRWPWGCRDPVAETGTDDPPGHRFFEGRSGCRSDHEWPDARAIATDSARQVMALIVTCEVGDSVTPTISRRAREGGRRRVAQGHRLRDHDASAGRGRDVGVGPMIRRDRRPRRRRRRADAR